MKSMTPFAVSSQPANHGSKPPSEPDHFTLLTHSTTLDHSHYVLTMKRTLLKSKIHRATVTDASLHYEGSITIDPILMQAANICEWEQVDVYDINNGNRLTTYAISGKPGSGTICLNGAAARLVQIGDLVIICSYAEFTEDERQTHTPKIILVDEKNQIKH
jgi:aspartate 1-decarboxylase